MASRRFIGDLASGAMVRHREPLDTAVVNFSYRPVFTLATLMARRKQVTPRKHHFYWWRQFGRPTLAELVGSGILGNRFIFTGWGKGVWFSCPVATLAIFVGDGVFAGGVAIVDHAPSFQSSLNR